MRSAATVVAALAVCTAVSAITTKPSVIKTTLQIFRTDGTDGQTAAETNDHQKPSFAARYWQQDISTGPAYGGSDDDSDDDNGDSVPLPSHKLSIAQQTHILDDIRRHNQQPQSWTVAPASASAPQPQDPASDHQLQELLQINGVAAADGGSDHPKDGDTSGRQRSIGNGGSGGWQPQSPPPQLYNRHQQHQPSLSPYVPPPAPAIPTSVVPPHQHQEQYYPTTTSAGPTTVHQQQRHQQQQQTFVTSPSSVVQTQHGQQQQQYIPAIQRPQYYPAVNDNREIDADIEQQIRQQLTAVVGAGAGDVNYTILNSLSGPSGIGSAGDGVNRLKQHVVGTDNAQYLQIGNDGRTGSNTSGRNRSPQPQPEAGGTAAGTANRNTIVKTVVIRQKPAVATATTTTTTTTTPAPSPPPQQQSWSIAEQQHLEQLARQVLPPGVAQYEIIRAGGVDGKGDGDATAAATVNSASPVAQKSSPAGGQKKPVTFVILEERPDGTVRVRGIEKKQHGSGAPSAGGGTGAGPDAGPVAAADDEQLQQLVDKLNRGELRLPSGSVASSSKISGTDSATAASTTASVPFPAYVSSSSPSSFPITSMLPSLPPLPPLPAMYNEPDTYFSTVPPQTTTSAVQRHNHFQNFFLPTVPTAAVSVATTAGGGVGQSHRYHNQHQQPYYTPPAVTTSAASTPSPVNTTSSYFNGNNKAAKDGTFSGALRRRGFYAMAKYMRQAGVDTVLEDTGPFTVFVPTDKAFRSLLVQLGGPDRAEDKFRENPRLLIGLLLHHVVPGAFKVADLRAGDEMTGVSLAGTQLRANLYSRQLYDNRWNDIEVLTVNGARVLDDVTSASSAALDDSSSFDDSNSGSVQQRRDMILSPSGGSGGNQQNIMAIAHAVDRVLFPLPVGDILATMRADRQRRYSVFLRAVDEFCSPSVRTLLTGSRTLTVFAPLDESFRSRHGSGNYSSSGSIIDGLFREDANGRVKKSSSRRIADKFVLSHVVVAGTGDPPMYTAGLRFYQVRDTAYRLRLPESGNEESDSGFEDEGQRTSDDNNGGYDGNLTSSPAGDDEKPRYYQLTVYKDSGKIRLNGGIAQISVRNVPATNGVLHGLDAPLV